MLSHTRSVFYGTGRWSVLVATCAALALGCATTKQTTKGLAQHRHSKWNGRYAYSYSPPQQAAQGSVPILIAVVNPVYKVDDSVFDDPLYRPVGKGFAASMGVDMDKVLISKGMTTSGPFPTTEEITYSQKVDAALTLAPTVFVTTQFRYLDDWHQVNGLNDVGQVEMRVERRFEMTIGGWVAFVMREPLSGEKMWVKRLDLDETVVSDVEQARAEAQYTSTPGLFGPTQTFNGYTRSGTDLTYDGKTEALADALQRLYPTIMEKFWIYMDPVEMEVLKNQTVEIRQRKVY